MTEGRINVFLEFRLRVTSSRRHRRIPKILTPREEVKFIVITSMFIHDYRAISHHCNVS